MKIRRKIHIVTITENYFVSIGAGAHPHSQPSDRHRRDEIEPRQLSLEVTLLNLSPAMASYHNVLKQ
jgi:hypothetical protein